MNMVGMIADKLSILRTEYGTFHSDAELADLACDWAEELADESSASVEAAFKLHRRECSRFPSLAHVVALLPRCRVAPTAQALPEGDLGASANWGRVREAARGGDVDAQKRMRELMRRVGVAC